MSRNLRTLTPLEPFGPAWPVMGVFTFTFYKSQKQIKITNRFAALENLNGDEDIKRAWESIKEYIKTSAEEILGLLEMKQHKPLFDEESLGILDQRKEAKIQWI
jgi:hypothetical protein